MMQLFALIAALVILSRCINIAAHVGIKDFKKHPFRFVFLASGNALTVGGAFGTVFGTVFGAIGWQYLFVIGVASTMLAERRFGIKRINRNDHSATVQ